MECWRCGESYETSVNGKVAFRMTCEKCHACLHSCVNCKNYQPGLPNDCRVPGTDPVRDREGINFCEEFVSKGHKLGSGQGKSVSDVGKSLFKDSDGEEGDKRSPEDKFDALF